MEFSERYMQNHLSIYSLDLDAPKVLCLKTWSPASSVFERWLDNEGPNRTSSSFMIYGWWEMGDGLVGGDGSLRACYWRVCLVPMPPLSVSWSQWVSNSTPPSPLPMMLCLTTGPEMMEPSDCATDWTSESTAEVSPSSYKLVLLRHFVTVRESCLFIFL
jgi:hypothetical protein